MAGIELSLGNIFTFLSYISPFIVGFLIIMISFMNQNIKDKYVKANNIRMGAEMRFKFFSLRTGYYLYGSPLSQNKANIKKNFTFGVGITNGRYYLDGGYILSMYKDSYLMYGEEHSIIAKTKHNFILTLGIKY